MTQPSLFGNLPVAKNDHWPDDYEKQFWAAYPRHVDKKKALAKLKLLRRDAKVGWVVLIDAVHKYAAWLAQKSASNWRPDAKHPTTWLNGECWNDEVDSTPAKRSFADIALGR